MSAAQSINASGLGALFTAPTSKDLAPSIIFLVLYVATLPVLAWRLIKPNSRTVILVRPMVFVLARLAMLAIRAVMAKTDYGEGILIAELILISIGFLFLLDPLIAIWKRNISSVVHKDNYPGWVNRLSIILRIALITAIASGVASGSLISGAIDDPSQMSTVISLRKASTLLSMAIIIITTVALVLTHISFGLDSRKTGYALLICVPLIIVSVCRVVQTFETSLTAPVREIWAFWVLQVTFEFIAYVLLIAISIPEFFPTVEEEPVDSNRINSAEQGLNKPETSNAYTSNSVRR